MGTRSTITVISRELDQYFTVYKHCDGYPSENLQVIGQAIAINTIKMTSNYKSYSEKWQKELFFESLKQAFEFVYRPNCIEEKGIISTSSIDDIFGGYGDTEFLYVIELESSNVNIFATPWDKQAETVESGLTFAPFNEIDSIKSEYQEATKSELLKGLTMLNHLDFTINGK